MIVNEKKGTGIKNAVTETDVTGILIRTGIEIENTGIAVHREIAIDLAVIRAGIENIGTREIDTDFDF